MNDKTVVAGIAVIILAVGGVLFWVSGGSDSSKVISTSEATTPGALELAQCLVDKGTTFYGSFTCPHCIKQKRLFGTADKVLPYVECTPPGGDGQLPVCVDKKIMSYPTWEFADGSRQTGVLSFQELQSKSGCGTEAPGATGEPTPTTVMGSTTQP